jgi:hypothetical protein
MVFLVNVLHLKVLIIPSWLNHCTRERKALEEWYY